MIKRRTLDEVIEGEHYQSKEHRGVVCFQQIDIESYGERHKGDPVHFKLFGRTMEGDGVICSVEGYSPYFYVAINQVSLDEAASFCRTFRQCLKHLLEGEGFVASALQDCEWSAKVDIFGYHPEDPQFPHFLKLSFINQIAMNAAKRHLESGTFSVGTGPTFKYNLYESNIPLVLKFMVDLNIYGMNWIEIDLSKCRERKKDHQGRLFVIVSAEHLVSHYPSDQWSKVAPLRMLSFDLECCSQNKNQFPRPESDPVIAIACITKVFGSKEGEYLEKRLFCLRSCAPIQDSIVSSYDSECVMLESFAEYLRTIDPDVLIGYNILNFDFPYLLNRAATLGCDSFAYIGRLEDIDGRIIFDIFQVMQRDYKLRSYSLNSVSAQFLNEQKEDVVPSIMADLFYGNEETRCRLGRYCLKDSLLPHKLNDRLLLFINYTEMARVTGIPFNYILQRGQQIKVISQLLRKTLSLNYILPTMKSDGASADEQYEGATVIEPEKGYYDVPIATLDFASLYPSIMMSHNLCYSTLLQPGQAEALQLDKGDVTTTPSGDQFVKPHVRKGILPTILEDLISTRKRAKQALKEAIDPFVRASLDGRQLALKISANSVYGFTGATVGKLPCLEISQSVTAFGRQMIEQTKELVEEHFRKQNGFNFDAKVIYGDTDSVMVRFGPADLATCMLLGREAAAMVNQHFSRPISLEFEKCYFPYLLINKKRYAGLYWTNCERYDKLDTKGIETVRRDNCRLVQTIIDTCLKMILIDRNVPGAIEYVKSTISDLLMNRIDISQLVISKALSKSGEEYASKQAHVELAEKMRKRDASSAPSLGDRVAYIIVKSTKGSAAYERAEDPLYVLENNVPIDFKYYLENQLEKPLMRLFEPILANPRELISGEHTRAIHIFSSPTTSAFSKFAVVRETCYKCKCILEEGRKLLCQHCAPQFRETFVDFMQEYNTLETKFHALWTQCQHCQGSFHQDILCTSKDCPIFYMRRKVQKDILEAGDVLQRFYDFSI